MKFLLIALLTLAAAPCATTGPSPVGVRWVAPKDDPDILLEDAKRLAAEMIREERCRAEFEFLPGWPVGDLVTRTVDAWSDNDPRRIARTMWRKESERQYEIEPIVEILGPIVINRSTSMVATVLIHETVHAASAPHVDDDAHTDNETLARYIAGLCARSYGLLYVPAGVAQN